MNDDLPILPASEPEATPEPALATPYESAPEPQNSRLGATKAILIIIMATIPLIAILYLGARLMGFPFVPFDLYNWPIQAGITPWISAIEALTGTQNTININASESLTLVQWALAIGLFLILALASGMAFYLLTVRRNRVPGLAAGLALGALFAAPMIFFSLIAGTSAETLTLPPVLIAIWLAALFITWGIALSYAFGYLMEPVSPPTVEDLLDGQIDRRQFLLQFGAGAAAITAIGAAGGALAPGNKSSQLQSTLPMLSPDFIQAQNDLFGNFRRFVIIRGESDSTEESNVVALGTEFPDRNYVSVWLGGQSPIVIYENIETAAAAFGSEDFGAGIYWLDE